MISQNRALEIADHAYAEHASGVVSDPVELAWLEGVEQALRVAAEVGTSDAMRALLDRMARVDAPRP